MQFLWSATRFVFFTFRGSSPEALLQQPACGRAELQNELTPELTPGSIRLIHEKVGPGSEIFGLLPNRR
jgi:hypothetical protein